MKIINDVLIILNNYVWALPMIIVILVVSCYFTVRLGFMQIRNLRHQFGLLVGDNSSTYGISSFAAFCSVVGYRVGTGNIAGVAVAIWSGGPGAIFWMLVTSLFTSAVSFAECSLGQVYKIKLDNQYRGGAYYYIRKGLGWKNIAKIYAVATLICLPILNVGTHANSIALAFKHCLNVPMLITGCIVAAFLYIVISGGIKRISNAATLLVPFVIVAYLVLTIITLMVNAKEIPQMLNLIITCAFGKNAVMGAVLGLSVSWGVRRSVNSSGAGMGEAVPTAAAAECSHPAEQGYIASMSTFIDVIVCLCSGLLMLITDCFNVNGGNGIFTYIGKGSANMLDYARSDTAGIVWVQDALSTVFGSAGQFLISICLLFFAFTTLMNYYYQGETALAFLFAGKTEKQRQTALKILRFVLPGMVILYSVFTADICWVIGELGVGIMVWMNLAILMLKSPVVLAVYKDYKQQLKGGHKPVFHPKKLGIENADGWQDGFETD